jgi:beta-N-acetylhexosaminidase
MPSDKLIIQNKLLQEHSKIPLFIACNPERGGDGVCTDGSFVGSAIKVAATGKTEYAKAMGLVSGIEMSAAGCNMAFAPVVDIIFNHRCEEVLSRSFGNDPRRVAKMGRAYMEGLHETEGIAATAKHFPGNGLDYRDAHVSNNINDLNYNDWMESYGLVYKELIEGGLEAIMGGHILMPRLLKDKKADVSYEEMLPATLCPEIMTDLLRGELNFNGMVVTDASHMVAMTNRMKRCDMLPAAINAGCDMFLFFNDPDEDFNTMLNAYRKGIISKERITEALTRIIGLKIKMGLIKQNIADSRSKDRVMTTKLCKSNTKSYSSEISRDSITLVKNLKNSPLPLSPEKTKRIMIVPIKGADNPLTVFMAMAVGEEKKQTPAEKLKERLIKKGFEVFIHESPIDKLKDMIARGEKPTLNLYFAGKHSIKDFISKQDLVISLFDVSNGPPAFGFSKGGGEIPWYVHELPVIGISVNKPTILADCPMLRTYINAYDSNDDTMDALVEALLTGDFRGKDPIDSFCGMWDTKI